MSQPDPLPDRSGVEWRREPRTGVVWGKQREEGSVVFLWDASDGFSTRTVSYGTWLTWERAVPDEQRASNEEEAI